MKKVLIVNLKNYPEVLGKGSLRLATAAESVWKKTGVEVITCPPTPMLAMVASAVKIPTFAQSVGERSGEKTTGEVTVESVREAGAAGTLLNHSEARVSPSKLGPLVKGAKSVKVEVCLCARTPAEVSSLARHGTEYLAVEPPELIGSGVAVSSAKPEIVLRSVEAARRTGYDGRVLCGAGIVSGRDVSKAVELGADGVLVSSGVVKAKDWGSKLEELARSLV